MSNITGEEKRNLVIIGSGPAGLTSGIYAARADLHPLLYEGLISGGQLINATLIENYPGFPDGIQGMELMEKIKKQAIKFGADLRFSSIEKVDFCNILFFYGMTMI